MSKKPETKTETKNFMTVNDQKALSQPLAHPTANFVTGDYLIPKLLLMQGLSEFVTDRKAQLGDIVRSTDGKVVGGVDLPIDIIPLTLTPEWVVQEAQGNKFVRIEPRDNSNDHLPWEFVGQGGKAMKRIKSLSLFALLADDVKNAQGKSDDIDGIPDLDTTVLPVQISFRSTSFNAGKAMATMFAKVAELSKSYPHVRAYHYTVPLTCHHEKNDKGTFYLYDLKAAKKTDKVCLEKAGEWYATLTQMGSRLRVHEEAKAAASDVEHF